MSHMYKTGVDRGIIRYELSSISVRRNAALNWRQVDVNVRISFINNSQRDHKEYECERIM